MGRVQDALVRRMDAVVDVSDKAVSEVEEAGGALALRTESIGRIGEETENKLYRSRKIWKPSRVGLRRRRRMRSRGSALGEKPWRTPVGA